MALSVFDIREILRPKTVSMPADDFRILDSWIEVDNSNKSVPERPIKYLCYKIQVINPGTGEKSVVYKAMKFYRVMRLPKSAKESKVFMDMHSQVLSAVYENEVDFITIIANIMQPASNPLGLLFLYGVQGVSKDLNEAKFICDNDYVGLGSTLQGTYRVMHLSHIKQQEAEWLRERMFNMEYMTVVRGIPKANRQGVDISKKSMDNHTQNPDGQGTLEEIILGMSDYEYIIQVLTTPVSMDTLTAWSRQNEINMTDWYEQLQGQKSLSFNLSIPMMYMANTSNSNGWSNAYSDSTTVSHGTGESYNTSYGENLSNGISTSYGQAVGQSSGHTFSNSISSSQSISNSVSHGQSFTHSLGETIGASQGVTHGVSQNFGHSVSDSVTHSVSNNISHNYGQNFNQGVSNGLSHGVGSSLNRGVGVNQGYGQTLSHNQSTSLNQGASVNSSSTESKSFTNGASTSESLSKSSSQSHSVSTNQNMNFGKGQTWSQNQGSSMNTTVGSSESQNVSHGYSDSNSWNRGHSGSTSTTESDSINHNVGWGAGGSKSDGSTLSVSDGASSSETSGNTFGLNLKGFQFSHSSSSSNGNTSNESVSASLTNAQNYSLSGSVADGHSSSSGSTTSDSWSNGGSHGTSSSYGSGSSTSQSRSTGTTVSIGSGGNISESYGFGVGQSQGVTNGSSYGQSQSVSQSVSNSQGVSTGWGKSLSFGHTSGMGASQSQNQSLSQNFSMGNSTNDSASTSASLSAGASKGLSYGTGSSDGLSKSVGYTEGIGVSDSVSQSVTKSISSSDSYGQSYSASQGYSQGLTRGRSVGESNSTSYTENVSQSATQSTGSSKSVGEGRSVSESTGRSLGESMGTTGAYATATGGSMGLGPSIGYSKSYQWLDQQVKDILEILEFENERLKNALRSNGAFYTYVYIACPSLDALSAAKALAKSTWQNENALRMPLQVLDLETEEQRHLLYHFAAFSADITRVNVHGASEYKYATVLLPSELVAYTHPPRISEGGIFADANDIPKFAVQSMMSGEIYMGTQLSAERYTINNGYRTPFDYRIDESMLMHGYFTGQSRSGKTVAAMRFIAELSRTRRKTTGKRFRIVCMDPKSDWRSLARFVEPERFNFYSLGNLNFHPIHLNPCKIPYGVWPQLWIDGLIDIYCRAYGLLERGKQMMAETIYALYKKAGVFEACDKDDWKETVPELSKKVTFKAIYKHMESIKVSLEDPKNPKGRAGNDTRDAYARLLDRLQAFDREYSIESRLFASEDGMGIDDLIGADDITVLESSGLESTFSNFIFGIITSGFYKYAKAQEGGYLAHDQYETVLVIEEANKVLTGNDTAGTGGGQQLGMSGQSEFEEILDQAAGYGLFIMAITQKISDMPSSIMANAGLVFAGRLKRVEDINVVIRTIAREERYEDRDITKWFPRTPMGWFICQTSRCYDFLDAEPFLVKIAPLNFDPPTNDEIDEILTQKKIDKMLREERGAVKEKDLVGASVSL